MGGLYVIRFDHANARTALAVPFSALVCDGQGGGPIARMAPLGAGQLIAHAAPGLDLSDALDILDLQEAATLQQFQRIFVIGEAELFRLREQGRHHHHDGGRGLGLHGR